VDITIDDECAKGSSGLFLATAHRGIECSLLVHSFMNTFMCFREIILVVKKILANNGYNLPYYGGLSSYSIVLMVQALYMNFKFEGIAPMLIKFFDFYGNLFNEEK
jgi:DNA polymerase sigma